MWYWTQRGSIAFVNTFKMPKWILNVWIFDATLTSSGSTSFTYTQNSVSPNYASNIPLLACLFLPALLLQVNQCTIRSPSAYKNIHFARFHSFIAGLNMKFSRQTCPRLHTVFQLAVCWNVRADDDSLVHFTAGRLWKEKKTPDKPTAECSICPSLSEPGIKEIISML